MGLPFGSLCFCDDIGLTAEGFKLCVARCSFEVLQPYPSLLVDDGIFGTPTPRRHVAKITRKRPGCKE